MCLASEHDGVVTAAWLAASRSAWSALGKGRLGTPPGGRGEFGGPTQALQPRIFCKPNFEIDLSAIGGASARLEFSKTKGPVWPGDRGRWRPANAQSFDIGQRLAH